MNIPADPPENPPPQGPATGAPAPKYFPLSDEDHLKVRTGLKIEVEGAVEKQIKKYAAWIITSVLFIVMGAIFATVWQLNGAIYQAVGRQAGSEFLSEVLKMKIQDLEKANEQYKKSVECLRNPKSKQTQECSHGN